MLKNYTPEILSDAAEKLLNDQPIEKISVQDIVEACGTTRTTFYRYYKDKYDIMNQVYKRKTENIIKLYINSDTTQPMIYELLNYIEIQKQYYKSITQYTGQNSFMEYIIEYGYQFYIERIKQILAVDTVSDELKILTEAYCHSTWYLVSKWLANDCKMDYKKLGDIICNLAPTSLSKYLY